MLLPLEPPVVEVPLPPAAVPFPATPVAEGVGTTTGTRVVSLPLKPAGTVATVGWVVTGSG